MYLYVCKKRAVIVAQYGQSYVEMTHIVFNNASIGLTFHR